MQGLLRDKLTSKGFDAFIYESSESRNFTLNVPTNRFLNKILLHRQEQKITIVDKGKKRYNNLRITEGPTGPG